MKLKSLLFALSTSLLAALSFAQSAPAAAIDSTVKFEQSIKKPTVKHTQKVSTKKHKAAKHKKTKAM